MAENTIKDVKLKIGTETQFQSKLKDLPINTLVGITDPIQEGELDPSIIDKLGKADSSLQKPTSTLAKESFVKVGIDGTQTFDENSYVVAPSTGGTSGQVLKKTASGTEWAGIKLYRHYLHFTDSNSGDKVSVNTYSTKEEEFTVDYIKENLTLLKGLISTVLDITNNVVKFDMRIVNVEVTSIPPEVYFVISSDGTTPAPRQLIFDSDEVIEV